MAYVPWDSGAEAVWWAAPAVGMSGRRPSCSTCWAPPPRWTHHVSWQPRAPSSPCPRRPPEPRWLDRTSRWLPWAWLSQTGKVRGIILRSLKKAWECPLDHLTTQDLCFKFPGHPSPLPPARVVAILRRQEGRLTVSSASFLFADE